MLLAVSLTAAAWGGTFGTVVPVGKLASADSPVGGLASDIALDEARGVLYIANFTAFRIDVMSLSDNTLREPIPIPSPDPSVALTQGSIAISPDGAFLVVTHFGGGAVTLAGARPYVAAVTVVALAGRTTQTFRLDGNPIGVAFTYEGLAVIATHKDLRLLDPVSGVITIVAQWDVLRGLPVPLQSVPTQILAASVTASADGRFVFGQMQFSAATIRFRYESQFKEVILLPAGSAPGPGPIAVSVNQNGTRFMAGFGLFNKFGHVVSEFSNPSGALNVGSHFIDTRPSAEYPNGVVYAQVPEPNSGTPPPPPILKILDADNLTLRQRINLKENLAGRSLLNSTRDVLYSVSDSGVTVLPVGKLNQQHRVVASKEALVFRGNICDGQTMTQEIDIVNPGGGRTAFTLTSSSGISVTPESGFTPMRVKVSVDPRSVATAKGTATAFILLQSAEAVNIPDPIRVLVNSREADQRGTFVNVPGTLVDVVADPVRSRFYVLRQDRNQVQIFDSNSKALIGTLRTAATPTQMSIAPPQQKYLLVGHNDSQYVYQYDLDTWRRIEYGEDPGIVLPDGHYPRSVAAANNNVLVAARYGAAALSAPTAGKSIKVDRFDLRTPVAKTLSTLGVFTNCELSPCPYNVVLIASENGQSIFGAMEDGNVFLFNDNIQTFTTSRKDFTELSGAFAASNAGQYVVGSNILNSSLVRIKRMDPAIGVSSGFVFAGDIGYRTTSSSASAPGVIQAVDPLGPSVSDPSLADNLRPVRMAEAPLVGNETARFTRTLAALNDRSALIALTASGFTVIPWRYDAGVPIPRLESVVNTADRTRPVAPGGLITVNGKDLSPVNLASAE
ncbi:MAG: hypothetical protein ABIZ80_15980, partial [Bryobacteraceae bacterium]